MLLLIMSVKSFCQDTTEVKNTTLDKIIKDLNKCDSLRVAYERKSLVLDSLVYNNVSIFNKLELSNEREKELQKNIDILKKRQLEIKPKKSPVLWIAGGLIFGIVVGTQL